MSIQPREIRLLALIAIGVFQAVIVWRHEHRQSGLRAS